MGNSAQEHRVAIGLSALMMSSSMWSPCTVAYKVTRNERGPDHHTSGLNWSTHILLLVTLLAAVQLWHLMTVTEIGNSIQQLPLCSLKGTLCSLEDAVSERIAGQVRVLLLLSGNVRGTLALTWRTP